MKQKSQPTVEQLILHGLRLGRWIILLNFAVLVFLGFKFKLSQQIERDVIVAQTKAELTQKTLLEFMAKTVDRWDKLQTQNPSLDVPKVTLPAPTETPHK